MKFGLVQPPEDYLLSPPAREVWVEIAIIKCGVFPVTVASREGGVG